MTRYSRRVFIVLEGPEGGGKSTLAKNLAARASECGFTVRLTREPGEGEFGKRIRQILLDGEAMVSAAELFLFLADRAQHVQTFIKPALELGEWVICDRFADSTFVYQAIARGLDADFVRAANTFAIAGTEPDIKLLVDVPAEVGLARRADRNRIDNEPIAFHEQVRQGFLQVASESSVWHVLDGTQAAEKVTETAWQAIQNRINGVP